MLLSQPFEIFLYLIFGVFLLIGFITVSLNIKDRPPHSVHLMIGVILLLIGGFVIIDLL